MWASSTALLDGVVVSGRGWAGLACCHPETVIWAVQATPLGH
jgi:hypothetical protein